PLPRWPDGLATFDPQTEILFTDKFFGAHVCGDQVLDEGWNAHLEDRRYYFDCLMAPHVRQVESALEKLLTKPAKLYATGHGPLVRYGLRALTDAYQDWLIQQKQKSAKVALVYASAYGNTATLAQAIARGLTKAGVAVESINAEFAEPEQLKTAIAESSGVIFGSPTLGGHPPTQIQTAMGITLNQSENTKLAGVFGSFGWSGEAVDWLESKFKDAGFQLGFEPIRVKFSPTGAVLQTCEEAGTDFAQALKKIQRRRKPKGSGRSSSSDRTLQALGRIVGPLCIVTTRQDDISSGMLASWVSQATFNPPGFTVAVAKDRAIESLLHVGSTFVLNVLKEGNHLGLMKHFLKPFGPGEDRFQDIAWEPAENGSPILADGLAHLECTVDKRMECGDHWLIYAIANQGQVKDTDGISVVHHRKTGSHY
ncbi:MAG: diflavin flavoprotein, partial [Cyanobacteria bacterium P01_H01_bin.15]